MLYYILKRWIVINEKYFTRENVENMIAEYSGAMMEYWSVESDEVSSNIYRLHYVEVKKLLIRRKNFFKNCKNIIGIWQIFF